MLLSFGGSVQAMINALKNNKRLLKHRQPYKAWKGAMKDAPPRRTLLNKKATKVQIKAIREHFMKRRRFNLIVGALAFAATCLIIYFIFDQF